MSWLAHSSYTAMQSIYKIYIYVYVQGWGALGSSEHWVVAPAALPQGRPSSRQWQHRRGDVDVDVNDHQVESTEVCQQRRGPQQCVEDGEYRHRCRGNGSTRQQLTEVLRRRVIDPVRDTHEVEC